MADSSMYARLLVVWGRVRKLCFDSIGIESKDERIITILKMRLQLLPGSKVKTTSVPNTEGNRELLQPSFDATHAGRWKNTRWLSDTVNICEKLPSHPKQREMPKYWHFRELNRQPQHWPPQHCCCRSYLYCRKRRTYCDGDIMLRVEHEPNHGPCPDPAIG